MRWRTRLRISCDTMGARTDEGKSRIHPGFYTGVCGRGLIRICYQIQNTVTPLYAENLGFSAASIGLLTTVATVASLVLRPFLGGWLDRYGRKWIAIIGTALFSLATFWNGYAAAMAMLIVVKAFQGLGFSAHTTAVNTMATDVLPEKRMSEGIGYMGLTGSLSLAVAPAIALGMIGGGAYRPAYTIAFVVGALATVSLLFFRGKPKKSDRAVDAEPARGIARFFEASNRPSAARRFRRSSNCNKIAPMPAGSSRSIII